MVPGAGAAFGGFVEGAGEFGANAGEGGELGGVALAHAFEGDVEGAREGDQVAEGVEGDGSVVRHASKRRGWRVGVNGDADFVSPTARSV